MDGNEKELSAKRDGIGDISSSGSSGAVRETPKGANKRTLTSLVTPIERNSSLSTSVEKGENSEAKAQKKKNIKENRRMNMSTNLGTMMHRMNGGLQPDEPSSEESTDEEELEAYLAQWQDEDAGSEDLDSDVMTDNERKQDEQMDTTELEGHEMEKNNDFGSGNDFTKVSSLIRSRRLATDVTTNGMSWKDRSDRRIGANTDTTKEVRFMDDVGTNRNQNKHSKVKNLGIASGRAAKETRMEAETLRVGPGPDTSPEVVAPTQKMYSYNIQLSFRQPIGANGMLMKKGNFNVPSCFKQVVQQLNIFSSAISLLPYNTNGIPITNANQLPDNEIEDYIIYYHNHHVTAGGQLTGMCCIEAPFAWYQLKDEKKTLFKWLKDKGVFMKYVSFKADQVSAAGWFYGMSPDVVKKDEVVTEIRKRLGANLPDDLSLQIAPRMLSITDKITRDRFSFKGVAIECERSRVKELQEALYKMDSPQEARYEYGITGGIIFVPFVENDVWTNAKILGMAKAHVQEMSKLGQIFLQNVNDIDRNLQWRDGDDESLRTMLATCTTSDGYQMIHSVHNTNRAGTVTILYYKEYTTEVNNTFPDIHELLERQLTDASKEMIAIEGKRILMTGKQSHIDSSTASKEYASYADIILERFNPQGGEGEEAESIIQSPPRKKQTQRRTPPRMTYSQVATANTFQAAQNKRKAQKNDSGISNTREPTTSDSDSEEMVNGSEVIETMQERFALMEAQFEARFGKVEGTDIETTKKLIEENNKEIQKSSEAFFEKKFEELSSSLTKEIQRSNEIIFAKFAALHDQQNTVVHTLQEAVKHEFLKIYDNMLRIQAGKPIEQATFTVAGPGTSQSQASDARP